MQIDRCDPLHARVSPVPHPTSVPGPRSSGRAWPSTLALLIVLASWPACSSDGGRAPDAGASVLDGGSAGLDGGSALDGGGAAADGGSDAGFTDDAGAPTDAGVRTDAGAPTDAGLAMDAGLATDAGLPRDGGVLADGGAHRVRFVAIGDTGKGNDGQRAVAAAIVQKCAAAGCDFAVLLGDNIYDSGASSPDDPQFQTKFEQPYAAVNMPFYVVLGNHDYGGGGAGYEFGKAQNEIDYTARSTKWRLPAAYYRMVQGPAEFFAMDTNMQMYTSVQRSTVDAQKRDMGAWLAASTATWKIALGHHPYLSNGKHGNAGSYDNLPFVPIANGEGVKDFFEDVMCGRVDLYLCGHDHSRQWQTNTCMGTELVVSGAGASTTELPGNNPARFQASTLGFLYVDVQGRTLTAQFIDVNGQVEFTRTLTK